MLTSTRIVGMCYCTPLTSLAQIPQFLKKKLKYPFILNLSQREINCASVRSPLSLISSIDQGEDPREMCNSQFHSWNKFRPTPPPAAPLVPPSYKLLFRFLSIWNSSLHCLSSMYHFQLICLENMVHRICKKYRFLGLNLGFLNQDLRCGAGCLYANSSPGDML